MSEWRPLETAPRDGSKLDMWTANGVRYIDVFWYKGPDYPEGSEEKALLVTFALASKLDFGQSGGLAERVNQASLKGL